MLHIEILTNFANSKTSLQMKTRLFIATAIFLMAMEGATAQYYTSSTPWTGPKGIGVHTGLYVPFNKNQYSATDYNYHLVKDSRMMLVPHIGLLISAFENGTTITWGVDDALSYAKGKMSFTFLDNGHEYTTNAKISFLDYSIKLFIGYSISEQLSVTLRSGITFSNIISTDCWQTMDNGEKKAGGFGTKNGLLSFNAICNVPIDLCVNYVFGNWFVRGSLDTRLITIRPMEGDVTLDENYRKIIHVKNPYKSIGCSVTFGFWWD